MRIEAASQGRCKLHEKLSGRVLVLSFRANASSRLGHPSATNKRRQVVGMKSKVQRLEWRYREG